MDKFNEFYERLIQQEALFHEAQERAPKGKTYIPDEESEDFFTSKEIVKMKENPESNSPSIKLNNNAEIEEDVHFKRYSKKYIHKYTDKEMEEIRRSCESTIVHDYSEYDRYHISDEERSRNDSLQSLRLKLNGLKRIYHKVDAWIEAMRVVIEAWELLEKKENFINTEEEFFELVGQGKIYNNGIPMPKLKGISKYNIDELIKYISNPELDASKLVSFDQKAKSRNWFDDDDDDTDLCYECKICGEEVRYDSFAEWAVQHLEECHPEEYEKMKHYEKDEDGNDTEDFNINEEEIVNTYFKTPEEQEFERLISPDEAQYILDHIDEPEQFTVEDIKYKFIKGYDRRGFGSSSKKKKLGKKEEFIRQNLHIMLNKIQQSSINNGDAQYNRSWMVTSSMFEPEKKPKDPFEDLFYDGSWVDDDALFVYDLVEREELLKQPLPDDRYHTYADKELANFFKLMEENGLNVVELRRKMNVSTDGTSKAEERQTRKKNRKIEAALISRISKLNQSDKFKKLTAKAEKAINEQYKDL